MGFGEDVIAHSSDDLGRVRVDWDFMLRPMPASECFRLFDDGPGTNAALHSLPSTNAVKDLWSIFCIKRRASHLCMTYTQALMAASWLRV